MPEKRLWLYDWIDTFKITEFGQAETLLKEAGLRRDLQKRAAEVPTAIREAEPSDAPMIVAGQAIDLSGDLDCFHWDCLKKQVDNLFSHVWHYFDGIVVVGPSAHRCSNLLHRKAGPGL